MNRRLAKTLPLVLMVALLVLLPVLSGGCARKPGFVIASILDLTGPAAQAGKVHEWAWKDGVAWINENAPIEGLTLRMEFYDDAYQTTRAVTGYRKFRDEGVKVIFMFASQSAEALKTFFADDKILGYVGGATTTILETMEELGTPGYIFAGMPRYEDHAEAYLEWISNTWDYGAGKPKIGVFGWDNALGVASAEGAQAYSEAHSDKLEWVDARLIPAPEVSWSTAVRALKDCDYLISAAVGPAFTTFVNELAGQVPNKADRPIILIHEATVSGWEAAKGTCGKENLDGTFYMSVCEWWTDTTDEVNLRRELAENHPQSEFNTIWWSGGSYTVGTDIFAFYVGVLREAAERVRDPETGAVNPDDITGELLYEIAKDIEVTHFGNVELERSKKPGETGWVIDPQYVIYQYDAVNDDFVRVTEEFEPFPEFRQYFE